MKIIKDFILRDIAGETILVPTGSTAQEFNGLITVTETAKLIWQNIEKVDSAEELVDMILEEYEVEEEIARRDVYGFVGALVDNGFAEPSKEDGSW